MKKLHILALSMLFSTSAIIMQADHLEEDFDQKHNLDKKRNDNTYDGSNEPCDGRYKFVDDGYDTFDEIHRLNKRRNSDKDPVCSDDHPLIESPRLESTTAQKAEIKEAIQEIKEEIKDIVAKEETEAPQHVDEA